MAKDRRKRVGPFGRPKKGQARKLDGKPKWSGRPPSGARLKKVGTAK